MKIVLTAINAKYIHSNLAVYSLKAYAKDYEQQVEIAEYTINQNIDDILRDLFKRAPDILCFSCYIWNLNYVEQLVKEISKLFPKLPIWLGGPEVSYDSREVLERLPEVTGVMKGEGEETFLEVLRYYHGEATGELAHLKGITVRMSDGTVLETPWREVLDLNKVPFVYDHIETFDNKIIYYESSRGCPFSCSYCLSSVDKRLRFRHSELVKAELQFFIDKKVPQVKFVDRTFNCNHNHAIEIWRFIIEKDNGITNFHFEVAADLLREEEIQLIKSMRPGLIQLEIGVQSTNPDTLREIRRSMDFQQVSKVVKQLKEGANIHQHLDLIAGLPYEDLPSFQYSFNQVYGLKPDQLQLGFLKVLKGSYMEERKKEYGLVYKSLPPYEVLYTKWLPYEEMLQLKRIEEMTEIYYNSGQFAHTMEHLECVFDTPYAMYQALGDFYEVHGYHQINHTRVARYEILWAFIEQYVACTEHIRYKQWLILDLYLRENIKNRPVFAGQNQVDKEVLQRFYEEESKEMCYLKGYDAYDKRQLRKMTHIERFSCDVFGDGREKITYVLFDYQNRNPLNHGAHVEVVPISE